MWYYLLKICSREILYLFRTSFLQAFFPQNTLHISALHISALRVFLVVVI